MQFVGMVASEEKTPAVMFDAFAFHFDSSVSSAGQSWTRPSALILYLLRTDFPLPMAGVRLEGLSLMREVCFLWSKCGSVVLLGLT